MLHQGLLPDVLAYNALISACEKATEPGRAVNVSATIPRPAMKPDLVSYTALVSACEKSQGIVTLARPCSAQL